MARLGRVQTTRGWHVALALGCLLLLAFLAGCSGSGNQLTPGLAGATQDHPAAPPQVAATGPGGSFAFVYDNQVWLRNDQGGVKQLTHLVLSNGATLVWGPLVWSPDGKYIAFALVQNLTPGSPTRSTGPLYYVDVGSGNAFTTPGTGSIYGHTYAWFATDRALIYSSTSDLMFYDLGDDDPRVWSLRTAVTDTASGDGVTFGNGGNSYGDITLGNGGNTLYYTVLTVTNIGGTGIIGRAEVRALSISQLNSDISNTPGSDSTLPATIAQDVQNLQGIGSSQVAPLGNVYSDATGTPTAGAWQLSGDGTYIAAQQIDGVDTGKGVVASHFCRINVSFGSTYCNGLFPNVGKYPIGTHAALALSANGAVAVTTDALYTQGVNGGGVAKVAAASGWGVAPAWSGDSKHLLATQLVRTTTDSGGVTRFVTAIVATDGGSNSLAFISGGMNPAWQP